VTTGRATLHFGKAAYNVAADTIFEDRYPQGSMTYSGLASLRPR
jgi:hypothetical protein